MDKKINIAICLSSEPRYWNIAAESISKFIKSHKQNCQIDVFYHFWDHITKRHFHLVSDPVIENIDKNILIEHFNPTVGVCENKDSLNSHLDEAWKYIQKLRLKYNVSLGSFCSNILKCSKKEFMTTGLSEKDAFFHLAKTTNVPPLSQLISMCKSFVCMFDYVEKTNTIYDIIIKTRSDVQILPPSFQKLKSVVNKKKLTRYIQFPSTSVRTPPEMDHTFHTPYVEYCFFMSSPSILTKSVFENYTEKLIKLFFVVKNKNKPNAGFIYRSSHNVVPLFLKQSRNVLLGAPLHGFDQKLKQMDVVTTESHLYS